MEKTTFSLRFALGAYCDPISQTHTQAKQQLYEAGACRALPPKLHARLKTGSAPELGLGTPGGCGGNAQRTPR